jgi:Holliday junction resolvasome RuvABC endonuclease subunit
MGDRVIKIYQLALQTLLAVILGMVAFSARTICQEQRSIQQRLSQLERNQIKILTMLKTDPVAMENRFFGPFDTGSGYQTNQ